MPDTLSAALLSFLTAPALAAGPIYVDVPEPSGIDYDRAHRRAFVVDDGGEIWVFDEDFEALDVFDVGGDLEGVAWLPGRGLLLVAVEGAEQLMTVDPDTGEVLSVADIPRRFDGRLILREGGQGIEALAVVRDRIFVANQSFDPDDDEDGSVLVELAFTDEGALEIIDAHPLPMLDVAGAFYSRLTGELFLLSDAEDSLSRLPLAALDAAGEGEALGADLFTTVEVPGVDQEGACVLGGRLVIAQDSGDLYDAGPLRGYTHGE